MRPRKGFLGRACLNVIQVKAHGVSQSLILRLCLVIAALIGMTASNNARAQSAGGEQTLLQARSGFTTQLVGTPRNSDPVDAPPAGIQLVKYPAPLGLYPAYVTAPPSQGKRYPAIIWLVGGFGNDIIGDTAWQPATPDNDQSAKAFRNAGIVTMYPSLRGGNGNAGNDETFFGEVNDVIAAAKYLATLSYVDPSRIYLGGHSTGGTLALLTAESTTRFRAVFEFGAVADPRSYGSENLTYNTRNPTETALRSPISFLDSITTPTYLFEGTTDPSNIEPLKQMASESDNPRLHFYALPGYTHFSELAEFTPIIAAKIVQDTGTKARFSFLSSNPPVVPVSRY